ncbi:DUF4250 domain-containing protein [Helcococcus kunzii]|uniref:DUF4250 domain-containing protein n=1 Tax=Helcococcus kunzii TaxID=40091 RepID=UPI0024AD672A|nr:DUF4250 domain-containing protein [Helcococcus kunzii]
MDYLNIDKNMLYSIVNMKLRDYYSNLEDFCKSEDLDCGNFQCRLKELGLVYNSSTNSLDFE